MDEGKLHQAVVAALNEYSAVRSEITESAYELAQMTMGHGENGGMSLLGLQQRLDNVAAEQALVVDQVLEDMDNPALNAQLKALAEEKQNILDQIERLKQEESQQENQKSRLDELLEWLEQQPVAFTEYNDAITRKMVARITVVDAETIRVKIQDTDVEIEQKLY